MTMAKTDLRYGDEILIPWGPATEVHGAVQEVYGPPARRHVLVLLMPELTGAVVDEPSTVLDADRRREEGRPSGLSRHEPAVTPDPYHCRADSWVGPEGGR
jgi:hypothetical protein